MVTKYVWAKIAATVGVFLDVGIFLTAVVGTPVALTLA